MATGWPAVLAEGNVTLRPLRRSDAHAWLALRSDSAAWLEPWDATSPVPMLGPRPTFGQFVRSLAAQARSGTALPFAIEYCGELAGQLTVSSITYGSLRSAAVGYWVGRRVAGHGVTPTAVAMVADHCFFVLGLHRIEAACLVENEASKNLLVRTGFCQEGLARRYLMINGQWADHLLFALLKEEAQLG